MLLAALSIASPAQPAEATGVIDPCPQMWDAVRGLYGGCTVFLPAVVVCDGCLSAWPVWPEGATR